MLFTVAMVLIILGISTWAVWLIFRHNRDESAEPLDWGQRLRLAWAHLYRMCGLARAGLRELWQRFQAWRDRKAVPAAAGTPPAPRPPAPRRPAGPAPGDGDVPLAPVPVDVTPAEIPPAFAPLLAFVSGFEADEDADLMAFTRGLAAGDLALADALQAQLDHCVTELGLDPVSVQGLADYADDKAEHAQGAMAIWQRFATVYAEVQNFVSSGGVLPKDGRFLTGEN